MKAEVAFVTLATGPYIDFVDSLVESLERHVSASWRLVVLTDCVSKIVEPAGQTERITYLPWGQFNWPLPTLLRYSAFCSYVRELSSMAPQFVYLDVDTRIVGNIDELVFASSVFAIRHPGHRQNRGAGSFERRQSSTAFVSPDYDGYYVAGGVQGGPMQDFLACAEVIRLRILTDLRAGLVAEWHDESHWNAFVADSDNLSVLDSHFCWPESWDADDLPESPRILALDKDHARYRNYQGLELIRYRTQRIRLRLRRWSGRLA